MNEDPWDWSVESFYKDGRKAYSTVHKGIRSAIIEVEAASACKDLVRVVLMTWREAGKPTPRRLT